ncbi:MAG: thiamine phosphate synthase [Candidatus Pelagibacter sp.]
MNIKYYYFIDEFNKNEIEKLSVQISLIYRNYHKKNDPKELKKLVIHCRNNRRKVYIANNLKDAIKYNFNGLYIPSFHKQLRFQNITRRNLEIIGSAHNAIELKIKENQGCSLIFLSPIFKNNKNKKFLDVIKTNLLKKLTKNQIVLLGGINLKTLRRSKLCAPNGVAAISWIKKNGPSINTGPF